MLLSSKKVFKKNKVPKLTAWGLCVKMGFGSNLVLAWAEL
jgi:hypothetical protein